MKSEFVNEQIITWARNLLIRLDEISTAEELMNNNVSKESAFLAIKAAQILNKHMWD